MYQSAGRLSTMNKPERTLVCIVCPLGCQVHAFRAGEELIMEGHQCPKGAEYISLELTNPVRMLTTTISVAGEPPQRLAVRTTGPIPKEYLLPAMEMVKKINVKPPVKRGQVIVQNLFNTKIDVVASCDI